MKIESKKGRKVAKNVGFFRFKKMGDDYLLTNDFGFHFFLSSKQFDQFIEGKMDMESKIYKELTEKGFTKKIPIYREQELIGIYQRRNKHLFSKGPKLHIMVLTLRCNYSCVYCHASSQNMDSKGFDMNKETAKKTVDFIFSTPAKAITIEFQGGEPLTNWDVLKFIIEYSRKKEETEGKMLRLALVSNLSLMTDRKLDFLIKNRVYICTSLDGPEKIHNRNRPFPGKNSYKETTKWIGKITKKLAKIDKKEKHQLRPGALVTVTKATLEDPKGVINEYINRDMDSIHFRYLNYFGVAEKSRDRIGYSADEFIDTWKEIMDYIISINKKGKHFQERESRIILRKMLSDIGIDYTDLRSPCGAALGQTLYNYDGRIFTCDEGRMLGDDTFLIGDVESSIYENIILGNKVKVMVAASCLENLPCDLCVYKPYCGICPVKHYAYYGNLFPQIKSMDFCKIKMAQFDYLFEKMKDNEVKNIFLSWVDSSKLS